MSITVDTVQLKFNVKPSYEQQQIQKLSADLKQATANYAALGKAAKDNAKEHSKLFGELARLKNKREELSKQKSLTEEQQQELARYNQKIEELTDNLTRNEEQRAKLSEVEAAARKDMVDLQNKMNGVNQSTLKYNMTIQQLGERERELRTLLNNIDPNTEEWEKYNKELSDTKKRIADLRRQTPDFHNELRLEDMTIKQLNERIGALRTALESCKPNTPEFKDYSIALEKTQNQLKKVEGEIGNTKNSLLNFHKGINFDQLKTMISANFLTMIGGKILDTVSEYAGRALNRVKELVAGSVEAARSAQGITHAFEKMDNPDLLKNLRQATHGTVSDLELMKAAVRAQDFRLPLDQLGKYLEFAQLKAQQTGQSVDYMTDSIVTGLGRKSKPILDNLGISASEIDEEMKKDLVKLLD
jgi:predicted  nucleic acid-binding Zn-ribbon protein